MLIHAAAGGLGHFTVQLARHLGAYVIGTSSAANKDFVLGLGAHEHIDYKAQAFESVVKDIDFVLDTIGGDNAVRSLEVIKYGGTMISVVGGLSEAILEKAKSKNINASFVLVESDGKDMQTIATLLEKKILRSHVSHNFAFHDMAAAHRQLETGRTVGKIVLSF